MKTIEELTIYYSNARALARSGNESDKAKIADYLLQMVAHLEELYKISSIIEKAKCKCLIDRLNSVIYVIQHYSLSDRRIQTFFNLSLPSNETATSKGGIDERESIKAVEKEDFRADENVRFDESAEDKKEIEPQYREKAETNQTESKKEDEDSKEGEKAKDRILSVSHPSFAPESLSDFIGQEHVVKRIQDEIRAAKKQGKQHIDHILLFGNRGLGKSTLMKLIARELGLEDNFEFMDASHLTGGASSQKAVHKFFQRISRENKPVVIAFDEIHALPKSIQTGLLTLLNDRVYTYLDDQGVNHRMPIPEFTFIGATTDAQDVLSTIKDRCNNLTFYLKDYSKEDLEKIFLNKFACKGLTVTDEVLNMCIHRCRASIREADAFVKGLNTKAINSNSNHIDSEMAQEYFNDIDRDPIGLTSKDLEILTHLLNDPNGTLSENTLAARAHLDIKTLEKEYEPYLLKIGFVNINSNGRTLTKKARDYLTKKSDESGQSKEVFFEKEMPEEDGEKTLDIIDDLFGNKDQEAN